MLVKKLKERRGQIMTDLEEIQKQAESAGGYTEEQRKKSDELTAEARKIDEDLKAHENITSLADFRSKPSFNEGKKEGRQYSIINAVRYLLGDRSVDATVELEASDEIAKRSGKSSMGLFIPSDLLARDWLAGTAGSGKELIATETGAYIGLLRAKSDILTRATILDNLTGNVSLPRFTAGATAAATTEGGNGTESSPTTESIVLSPKEIKGYMEISRTFMQQSSPAAEDMAREELFAAMTAQLAWYTINGNGSSGTPTGLLNTSGVNLVALGANGAAPTHDHMVSLETEVAIDNADFGDLAYVGNAKVRGKLKTTKKDAGSGIYVCEKNEVNGYPLLTTNHVPSDLVKGSSGSVCSAIIFGNLKDIIVGLWGQPELIATRDAKSGVTTIGIHLTADVQFRRTQSFAVIKDALTA